jgi:hypothetical protein
VGGSSAYGTANLLLNLLFFLRERLDALTQQVHKKVQEETEDSGEKRQTTDEEKSRIASRVGKQGDAKGTPYDTERAKGKKPGFDIRVACSQHGKFPQQDGRS